MHLDQRHPVLRQEYAIFTPPMHDMISTIGDWIDLRVSGGYVYGPSRFGKSRTVKWYLREVLKERFRLAVPLVVWIRQEGLLNEGAFWNGLLGASKYKPYDPLNPRTRGAAKILFEQRLFTLARSARGNYVVLVIDEAHAMTLAEWEWLLGLQNALDDQGIRLTVFSIGSHGLRFERDYLAKTGNAHIAARFFSRDARFHGIASIDDLGYVLNGYDVDSEWPKGSGISYLQYFAPGEFSNGKRLKDCSCLVWNAFEELLPLAIKSHKKMMMEIPMQHLTHTVEQALRRLAAGREWSEVTSYPCWLEMIAKTGFTSHMRMIY